MKNPFFKLTPQDIIAPDGSKITTAMLPPMPAPVPVSDTVVGSVVVMLDKSYQAYLSRRATLEADIAREQELLRQTNTVIASLEAALTVAAVDPALTDSEKQKAFEAADARFSSGMPVDICEEATEPSMGFGVGELKKGSMAALDDLEREQAEPSWMRGE